VTGSRLEEKEGGREASFDLAPAQFVFRPQTTRIAISNPGPDAIELVEFQLK